MRICDVLDRIHIDALGSGAGDDSVFHGVGLESIGFGKGDSVGEIAWISQERNVWATPIKIASSVSNSSRALIQAAPVEMQSLLGYLGQS